MQGRTPLAYTFGNHMHWVDMQWLWGYGVLPGSTEDMLAYCKTTGAKGCLNFDGIGLEKMASEAPEHLAMLRQAVADGTIEVVGGSYGQPYGLFHGGESNIRQRIYGIRTSIRLLNHRPRTFWEEEFDFYPQLPQMLKGLGFTGASLYFQWTWHTPEIPYEEAPVVEWQGVDGTGIPTATRNRMNLHQWPEDFKILLDDLAANPPEAEEGTPPSLVLQWLELMPTQDWMCRSELMAPMLTELKNDPRFDLQPMTLTDYLALWRGKSLPVRQYKPDDVWHGMTLGKNGDNHPKASAYLEQMLLEAETAATILSLFGRPYKPWDIYPTWELEECWRNLLAAQHHDNHECEGLCGHVAEAQFAHVDTLLRHSNSVVRLLERVGGFAFFNPKGWPRIMTAHNGEVAEVPAFGYKCCDHQESQEPNKWTLNGQYAVFEEDDFKAVVNLEALIIEELVTSQGRIKDLSLNPKITAGGSERSFLLDESYWGYEGFQSDGQGLTLFLVVGADKWCKVFIEAEPHLDRLKIAFEINGNSRDRRVVEPGYQGAVKLEWPINPLGKVVTADLPYSVYEVQPGSSGRRKYPTGDWMTSPQWFEPVEGAFVSHSFVNLQDEDSGVLISHSGSQGWFLKENCLETVLLSQDPWDEENCRLWARTAFYLTPHQGLSKSECLKRSARVADVYSFKKDYIFDRREPQQSIELAELPRSFSAVTVHSPHVLATAFYREESAFCSRGLESYAGQGILHPFILRLVEADGVGGEVALTLPGPIAKAFKTNLLGEVEEEMEIRPGDSSLLTPDVQSLAPFGIKACQIHLNMRPYEIATLYLDIIPGRKVFRDLDAKREIWATLHRTEED